MKYISSWDYPDWDVAAGVTEGVEGTSYSDGNDSDLADSIRLHYDSKSLAWFVRWINRGEEGSVDWVGYIGWSDQIKDDHNIARGHYTTYESKVALKVEANFSRANTSSSSRL